MLLEIVFGCLLPFFGTLLGAACVFFTRRELGKSSGGAIYRVRNSLGCNDSRISVELIDTGYGI